MTTIIDALHDEHLFRPFLGADLATWRPWCVALRAVYGLTIAGPRDCALVRECTGRPVDSLPEAGFRTALFLTGRRSGKSRIAAIVGAYEAALAGHQTKLAPGESGIVAICAPTKRQARVVHKYVRHAFKAPLLEAEIVEETREGFKLSNGIEILILAGDWRTVRGPTLIAAVVDEVCFFGVEEESKIRSDTELVRAIRPGLATTRGKLITISSPYAKKGWAHSTWKRDHGNALGRVLVWCCPSRTMNPTLDQQEVDDALAEDLAAAKSEYLGEWRDDISEYLPRSIIEGFVVTGRKELPARSGVDFYAFTDVSGGRADDSALAVAHRDRQRVVIDFAQRWRSPHNPHEVVAAQAEILKRYGVQCVTGDNYSAEFTASSFESHGISYTKCAKPKSELYRELLPRLCSGEVELLDDETTVGQLAALERRTRSGGKDIIDHPRGGHDDLANTIAGVVEVVAQPGTRIGGVDGDDDSEISEIANEIVEEFKWTNQQ